MEPLSETLDRNADIPRVLAFVEFESQ